MPTASNNQKAVLLSSISIYDYLGNKLKEWQFDYDYFISGIQSSFDVSASKRLFLKSLKELSSCDSIVNIYSFEYYGENGNEPQMPYRHSFAGKDVWGYFNGVVTTVQAEDPRNAFCEFSGIGFNKTYRYFDAANREITGSQNIPVSYTPLSVHNVNPQLVSTYSLKRITYPTGGHTTFEYEPNTFRTSDTYPYSIFAPSDTLAGGQRIKKITDYDGISTSVRTFCYSSGDLPEIPRFIEEKTYESFRTSLVGNSIGGSVIIYHGDLNNYLIFYPNPVNSTGISNADNVIYPEVIETLSDGTQTIYHFETLTGLSSNLTTRIFDLGRPCHGRYFEVYSTREDMNYKATTWGYVTDIDYIDFANLGSQDHLFNVGNHIKERPESFSNGYQGRFGTFFARGQLKEKTVRDADSMLVLKEEYTYTLKDLHVIPALDITNNLMPNVNSVLLPIMHSLWPNSPIPGNYTTMPEIYYLNFYFYLAGNSQLTSKRIIEYRSSGTDTIPIIRREDYTYNSYNLLSATSLSTISRTEVYHEAEGVVNEGDIVYWDEEAGLYYNETNDEYLYPAWTEIVDTPVDTYTRSARYPSDINTGVYADMVANHMLNYIIEQCEVINGSTISASLTEYSLQGNSYYPSAIYTYTPNEPNSSFQNFNGVAGSHYGSPYFLLSFFNGRLASITDKAGITTSYEWNKHYQYPTSESFSGGSLTHNRQFTYSQRYGMTSETSATGYKLLYGYDNSGKLTSICGKPTDSNNGYLLNQYQYHIANASLDSTSLGSNQITSMVLLDDTVHHCITTVDYFDGLGRKIQSIGNGLIPGDSYHAILSRIEYDGNGREWRKYLPVSVIGFNYIETPSFKYDDNMALSEVNYDALDRTLSIKTPGSDMGERYKKHFYWTNPDNSVKRYAVSSDSSLSQDGYHPAGILTMERVEDEDGHVTEVYSDFLGRKVLERRLLSNGTSGNTENVDTYYVYDDCGNLCFVLQPMFQTEDDLEKYSFRYSYNSRGLMTEKIIPGCDAITYTYDNADRLLTMQDAEMRNQGTSRHYTYDGLGRVMTQTLNCNESIIQTEQRNYYDGDYQFITNGDVTLTSEARSILGYSGDKGVTSSTESRWGKTFTSGTVQRASDGTDMVTAFYYNSRGLVVEKNMKLLGSHLRREQFEYTFTGKVSRHTTIDYDGTREMLRSITVNNYDAVTGKLVSTDLTTIVNGNNKIQRTAVYEYDNYGRVHGITRGPSSQTWTYDVRDWPTRISSHHFTEALSYTGRYYNGSINSIHYTDSCSFAYAYQFTYDGLNRLRNAEYSDNLLIYDEPPTPFQPLSSSNLMLVPANGGYIPFILNKYGEEIEYDKNCNITRLKRYGAKDDRGFDLIDDLYISYNGNQRDTVRDEETNLSYTGSSEFVKNGFGTYSYNGNGSLESDENRGILSIEYDDLGNPKMIIFTDNRSIEYVYSPDGEKLRTIHSEPRFYFINPIHPGLSPIVLEDYKRDTTDYIGSLILKNGHPAMLLYDGGYASFEHDTIDGWHYYIQDYMGNNRMVVNKNGTVEQVTHYYPYGGIIGDISTNENVQKYKFEGKELDRTFGLDNYDIHARQYFAMAPMWDKPDSKAEEYYHLSPYVYCGGDPVNQGDYNGRNTVVIMTNSNLHIALLVQDNDKQYRYYSINGKDYQGIGEGHSKFDNLGEKSFSSVDDFFNSPYNTLACDNSKLNSVEQEVANGYHYTVGFELTTSPEQDAKIAEKFKEMSETTNYALSSIGGDNCATTVNASLRAGGVITGCDKNAPSEIVPAFLMDNIQKNNPNGIAHGNKTFLQIISNRVNIIVEQTKYNLNNYYEQIKNNFNNTIEVIKGIF